MRYFSFVVLVLLTSGHALAQSPFDQSAYNRRKRAHEDSFRDRTCKDAVRHTNDLVVEAAKSADGFFKKYLEIGPCGNGLNSSTIKFELEDGRVCTLDISAWTADDDGYPSPDCN